ncbi:hypothetical protein ACLMJK_004258 [Lecanora helva]
MAQCQQVSSSALIPLMASSDVDQKFLGRFSKATRNAFPGMSAALYQVLGLSVLLSKKLVRARRLRRLDTTRDTKSLQLYHHIIFLSREGLIITEENVLPLLRDVPPELQVLVYKLRASFYHIFVLFHNQPSINQIAIPSYSPILQDPKGKGKATPNRNSLRSSPPLMSIEGGPVRPVGSLPPGLTPVSIPKPSATFLLPAQNYIPKATEYFEHASNLADACLSGSHPIRLSVKTEYAAYLYDCLHDGEASRKLAQSAIRDVYNAQEGMDDDMFEDAAELVGILGRMMKRGLSGSVSQGSMSTPRAGNESTPRTTPSSTPRTAVKMDKFQPVPNLPARRSTSPKGDPQRRPSSK